MKKISGVAVTIIKWALSILFLLFGLVSFSMKGIFGGIVFLAMAILVNPLFAKFLETKGITVKKLITIPALIVAFFVGIFAVPTSESTTTSTEEIAFTTEIEDEASISEDRSMPNLEEAEELEEGPVESPEPSKQENEQKENTIAKTETQTKSDIAKKQELSETGKVDTNTVSKESKEQDKLKEEKSASDKTEEVKTVSTVTPKKELPPSDIQKDSADKQEEQVIAETVKEPEPVKETPAVQATEPPAAEQNSNAGGGNANNFDTYDIAEQQQTSAEWVLNNKTKKIHYPSCKDVRKIKPENYGTSNSSLEELQAQDYSTCGHCFN